ncbi:MAG: flagellar hook-length control protein FliK, partial [Planctomyces sp.]
SQQSQRNSSTTVSQVTSADAGTGKTDVNQTKNESAQNQDSSAPALTPVSDRQPLPPTTTETLLSPDNSVDAGLYDITGVNDDQSAPDRDTVRSNAAGSADSPSALLNETDRIKGAQTASDGRGDSDADIRKALSTVEIVRDAAGASSVSSDFGMKPTSSSQSVPSGFGLEQPSISVSNGLVAPLPDAEDLAAASMNSAGESVVSDRLVNSRSGGAVQSVSGSDTTMNAGNSGAGVSAFQPFTESVAAESRLPMTSQVSRAVYELVQRQSGNENSSLTLRLDPPTLGELVIQLSKTEDGIAARVTASEPVTMDMLLARGAEIESQLKSQDLNFSGIEFLGPGAGGSDSGNSGRRNAFTEGSENGKRNRGNGSGAISGSVTNSGREQAPQRAGGMSFRA